jgi:phospholipid/cholesterol/gamma-HCH transport system substrate-binding protein
MPRRVSSAAIGMFVVGSVALLVGALVILGSGRLFAKRHLFVCFFKGSVNGLQVGAPVKVRGVPIGSVLQIMVQLPPRYGRPMAPGMPTGMPVIFEINESQLKSRGGTGKALAPGELRGLIQEGLRAQLATQSFLTGLLYIDLDLHPKTPAHLTLVPGSGPYREIPTIPTDLEQVQQTALRALAKLDKVDFVALTQSMTSAAASVRDLLTSQDVRSTIGSMKEATQNLSAALVSFRKDFAALKAKTDPLFASLKATSDQANLALAKMTSTLGEVQMTFAPQAPLTYRLEVALQNLSEASSAMRQLADYLQRNPSALIRGRYVGDQQR